MKDIKINVRYLPRILNETDEKKQLNMLLRSKKLYKSDRYYTRKELASYPKRTSRHILRARQLYDVDTIFPNEELSKKTGCSVAALEQIVRKGAGAYYSSGSRPNQTPQSWGLARLASSVTGGKAAAVDYDILRRGCSPRKPAMILANQSRKKYNFGRSKTKKRTVKLV